MADARRGLPSVKSLDTTEPSVHNGLNVMQFEVVGAIEFCREITMSNVQRIRISQKDYELQLFTAAIASGLSYGAMAERMR